MQPSSHSSVESSEIDLPHLNKLPLSNIITRGVENTRVQQKLHLYFKNNNKCIPIVLQRHPIEKDVFFIVAGEQAYFFAQNEGFENVLSYTISVVDRDLDSLLQILPHIHPYLHCLEQAYIYNFLLSHPSYTQEELSELLAIGRSTISRILKLTRLPHILQQDLLQNQLRVSLAKEFSTITDFSMCMKLYACHQKKPFTVVQLREEIKKHEMILDSYKKNTLQLYSKQELQDICSQYFMQTCKIIDEDTQCHIEIQFKSLIELQMWLIQQQEKYGKK